MEQRDGSRTGGNTEADRVFDRRMPEIGHARKLAGVELRVVYEDVDIAGERHSGLVVGTESVGSCAC